MATELAIHFNTGAADVPLGSGEWTELNSVQDVLYITGGSDVVADGEPIPSETELNQAGIRLSGVEVVVDEYMLGDVSENEIKKIDLMGNQNTRYVIAFEFDGATATEPTLEAWDDDTFDSVDSVVLGGGTPNASWFRAVSTTDSLPGSNWTGVPLAGSSNGNFVELNNGGGALDAAETLYANLKVVIPSSQLTGSASFPVLVCKYATN